MVSVCLTQSCILQLEFIKPERGGLGFSLVGGVNGSSLQIKDIRCGGVAEQDGRLHVGDILLEVADKNKSLSVSSQFCSYDQRKIILSLQVNGVIVSGLSHIKVVDILRRAEGTVQLTVYRDTFAVTCCTGSSCYTEDAQEPNTKGLPPFHLSQPLTDSDTFIL